MSNTLEFRKVEKEKVNTIKNLALENNCRIEKTLWTSKYKSYIVYEYEPLCSDGFIIDIVITSSSKYYLKFVKYLVEKMERNLEHLEKCGALEDRVGVA